MDRLNQLKGEVGGSRDSTLDTSSPPSESFMTANESPSKYYSLSEVDSTFDISMKDDISAIKDVSLASTTTDAQTTLTNPEELISNLSPIGKKGDILDTYKIDTQIEAANILSGGVAIFDDNSYDGNELVIDDNVEVEEKSNAESKISENLELKPEENITESVINDVSEDIASNDTEVVLQIDGKSVDAINIGNQLYLYRKEGQEELAAVQIIDVDEQQPSFKFLKVRENAEGNLEVYEEIEIEVPEAVHTKDGKITNRGTHVPISAIKKVINEPTGNKATDKQIKVPKQDPAINIVIETDNKDSLSEIKSDVNFNGKMVKLSESRKSPVIGSFTPMTYHSTPKKEGIPLTKTMVDQQLHPNRHSDLTNTKKKIEVHTDNSKKSTEIPTKCKDPDTTKLNDSIITEKETMTVEQSYKTINVAENFNNINEKVIRAIDPLENNTKAAKDITETNENVIPEKETLNTEIDEKHTESTKINPETDQKHTESTKDEDISGSSITKEQIPAVSSLEVETENIGKDNDLVKDEKYTDKMLCKSVNETTTSASSKTDNVIKSQKDKEVSDFVVRESKVCALENTPGLEDITQIIPTQSQEEKNVEDNKMDIDEPILIDDENDVSIVEVGVDSKCENDNEPNSSRVEVNENSDDTKPEVISKENDIKVDEQLHPDFNTSKSLIESETINKLIIPPNIDISSSSEIKYEIKKGLSTQNNMENESLSTACIEPVNQNIHLQENKEISKSPGSYPTHSTLPTAADSIQINSSNESTATKNVTENEHPLVDQNQKSLLAVLKEKSEGSSKNTMQKHIASKNVEMSHIPVKAILITQSAPVHNIKKIQLQGQILENNIASKVVEMPLKNIPVKLIPVTKPVPTHLQKMDGIAPPIIDQFSTKNSVTNNIARVLEVRTNTTQQPTKIILAKPMLDPQLSLASRKDDNIPQKVNPHEKSTCVMDIEITKVTKVDTGKSNTVTRQNDISSVNLSLKTKSELKDKQDISKSCETKPINNNQTAVPFGKWTDANRQEFLNKFKIKASAVPSNSNQLKNSKDLNRRDVLKKIDSQRQSSTALSKGQESNKHTLKSDTAAFTNKANIIRKPSIPHEKTAQTTPASEITSKVVAPTTKIYVAKKSQDESSSSTANSSKEEVCQTKGYVQNLIDKTIEGMIHRNPQTSKKTNQPKKNTSKAPVDSKPAEKTQKAIQRTQQPPSDAMLDEIEMKMNELHGIPFIERPAHELPQVHTSESKNISSAVEKEKSGLQVKTKIPNLLPFSNKNQEKNCKENTTEVDSEDEIIEHEPITGDIDLNKKNQTAEPPKELSTQHNKSTTDTSKIESVITERDFETFARRNSVSYENCIAVNFDGKEAHNVVQTVIERDPNPKKYSGNNSGRGDSKTQVAHKHQNLQPNIQPAKENPVSKVPTNEDTSNKNQSKVQKAYYSALTEKRQKASDFAVTILEDKPVKVMFVDETEYASTPTQLDVQGKDLSPSRNTNPESDITVTTSESHRPDGLEPIGDPKSQDDCRSKTKHQRKQVLTPVEEPELELIEPRDLGVEVSPKKKRRTDEDKIDKNLKHTMRKNYVPGSSTETKITQPINAMKNPLKDTVNINDNGVTSKSPVSALDSLVKAAELIETQTENFNTTTSSNSDNQANTPLKRGRGRPRKYPLTPEGNVDKSKALTPSPQKKPRLTEPVTLKRQIVLDDSDSDEEMIRENWTMGKINENIVCPICNKLFRTENVVFKHVKHCSGPSPSRSDSDKRSSKERGRSRDSDTKSQESQSDMDIDDDKPLITQKLAKKRKSKNLRSKSVEKDDVIVIEDTPIKEKSEKIEERKAHVSRNTNPKTATINSNLVCEFCGKTFRQLSYLVNHKQQHKKPEKIEPKNTEKQAPIASKSVFSCEVCKKEFRKLHHLVQHRIIHNPTSMPARTTRKSSSEHSESKVEKETNNSKQNVDPSTGFRCEPCDKSFRKLHHLVEHRETHDGINRQKANTAPNNKEDKNVENPTIHQCDICKKIFKKLVYLNEHKEQHVETCSEKSDDKSVKSSLSTKDIIHECSLCYMVFPNEHSLNKHGIICQRKKRQSKLVKPADETDNIATPDENIEHIDSSKDEEQEIVLDEKLETITKIELASIPAEKDITDTHNESIEPVELNEIKDSPQIVELKLPEPQVSPVKRVAIESSKEAIPAVPQKIKKVEHHEPTKAIIVPKKKTIVKDKTGSTVKRLKTTTICTPTPVVEEVIPVMDSSDDDDVRYMLNPNFKVDEVTEEKVFMKVRANKRSSLQIERPDSKDLMKRRTSLQMPPKISRLKPKPVEPVSVVKKEATKPKLEPVPSTDSDDSDTTKYAFPSTVFEKQTKTTQNKTHKESDKKTPKKTLTEKRKSLIGIAKRKSLGKPVKPRLKVAPLKLVKKRTLDAEHRCDCGQLFSSATLLSQHTTLAHTPPRIRRRRSPSPDTKPSTNKEKTVAKPPARKSTAVEKPKLVPVTRKSSGQSGSSTTKLNKSEVKNKSLEKNTNSSEARKSKSVEQSQASGKQRRSGAHRGVPVPEKMKKLVEKMK